MQCALLQKHAQKQASKNLIKKLALLKKTVTKVWTTGIGLMPLDTKLQRKLDVELPKMARYLLTLTYLMGTLAPITTKIASRKPCFFYAEMFQLEPSTKGVLGIDNQHSLATMANGLSNATQEMS